MVDAVPLPADGEARLGLGRIEVLGEGVEIGRGHGQGR
jgi:hypothetical protein